MKKSKLWSWSMLALLLPVLSFAQSSNPFLDRAYWKENPTVEDVKKYMAEGHDPLALNPYGFNGLVYGILENAPYETLKYLADLKSTDINVITHDGRSYLHWAAGRSNLPLMKDLVKKGLKTTDVDDHGYTVLNFAAVLGQSDPELYDYLLANGSSFDEKNHDGANALLLLTPLLKDFSTVDYFLKKGLKLNVKDENGSGAFYYTAKSGNVEMMDLLIEKGLSPAATNNLGANAMIAAAYGPRRSPNSLEVFQYLDEKGVEANVVTKEGVTPLIALSGKIADQAVLEFFLERGVDINQTDDQGNNALIVTAGRSDLELVKFITEKTTDINSKNKQGVSALTKAVEGNSPEVVEYLLGKSADARVVDAEGNSLAFYLINSYQSRNPESFEKKLKMLEQNGVSFLTPQAKGQTMLHLAVEANELYLIRRTVELGADVNASNDDGLTPLQIAAMKAQDEEVLKYLLEQGADRNVKTDFEETVYDLASENELLSAKGVDIEFLRL